MNRARTPQTCGQYDGTGAPLQADGPVGFLSVLKVIIVFSVLNVFFLREDSEDNEDREDIEDGGGQYYFPGVPRGFGLWFGGAGVVRRCLARYNRG
jgi:hypothetical protein